MSNTIKLKAHIHGHLGYDNKPCYTVFPTADMTSCGYFHVAPVDVEVDFPDGFEPTAAAIGALEKEKVHVRAELTRKLTDIDRQIQTLQALPA